MSDFPYRFPPGFSTFRPGQEELVDQIVDAFNRVKIVILEAPTGTGKTWIGEAVRQRMESQHNAFGSGFPFTGRYICTTKGLQRQFLNDFPYARLLQGMANYPTDLQAAMWPSIHCGDCQQTRTTTCGLCRNEDHCPYRTARRLARTAPLSVLNSAYWLRQLQGASPLGAWLAVVDEADTLESQLMSVVEIRIPKYVIEKAGLPKHLTKPESWDDWLQGAVGRALSQELVTRAADYKADRSIPNQRRLRAVTELVAVVAGITLADGRWVLARGSGGQPGAPGADVVFKPVWVDGYGPSMLWGKAAARFLLMSATVISAATRMRILGQHEPYEYIQGPSVIPAVRRPVIIRPAVDMSRKARTADHQSWKKLVAEIGVILGEWVGHRVLVHSVSYELTNFLARMLDSRDGQPLLFVTSTSERDARLAQFKTTPGAVLVAPGFDRGVDLAGNLCRVAVWCKVPFPNLGDPQVAARLYGSGRMGRDWYAMETVATVVQGAGRVCRGEKDWGVTYILDSQVTRLFQENQAMVPRCFAAAVDTTGGVQAMRDLAGAGVLPPAPIPPAPPSTSPVTTARTADG